jgi:hypothetical protein
MIHESGTAWDAISDIAWNLKSLKKLQEKERNRKE